MKIGILTSPAAPNWGGSYALQKSLLEALIDVSRRSPHQFIVFNQLKLNISKNELGGNIKIINVKNNSFIFSIYFFLEFIKHLFRFLTTPGSSLNLRIIYGISKLRKRNIKDLDVCLSLSPLYFDIGKPYILPVWDLLYLDRPELPEITSNENWTQLHNHYEHVLLKASKILVTSSVTKEKLIRVFGVDSLKIKIIPLPITRSTIGNSISDANRIQSKKDEFSFALYPAQIWAHKNHIVLIEAFNAVKERINFNLIFTGYDKGNWKYLYSKIIELGLENRIIYKGYVDDTTLESYMNHSLALLFPSIAEPDNLPAIDAILRNKTVYCANVPGIFEQLGKQANYLNPFDVKSWAEALLEINKLKQTPKITAHNISTTFNSSQSYIESCLEEINNLNNIIHLWK